MKTCFSQMRYVLHEAEMQAALLTDTSFAKILVQFLYVPHSWSFVCSECIKNCSAHVFKETIIFYGYIWLLLTPFIWDLKEEGKMSCCFMQDTGTAHTESFSVIALEEILGE